jgi:molybdopterin-containing oxidoreductase family iron-sulfur binding subunit
MPSPASKSSFASLRDKVLSQNGKEYWRSIEEHADTPEFREFIAEEYPHEIEEWDNSLSRRNFVKVMGASLALAGLRHLRRMPILAVPVTAANGA